MQTIKKTMSTLDREMQDSEFKEAFNKEYKEFALSELLLALMAEDDDMSVRKLAKAAGISPSVIQRIRSGKQQEIKVGNFISIIEEFGYNLVLEKGSKRIQLSV